MPRDNREVERALQTKFSFTTAPTQADDHRWLELTLPGLPTIKTKFSHTREDIRDELWRRIAAQLHVRPNYLTGMVSCSNSRIDYYKTVREDPFPPWPQFLLDAAKRPPAPSSKRGKGKRKRK